jgi:excinuclease ABC subunit B
VTVPIAPKSKIIPATEEDLPALIAKLTKEMKRAAKNMEFERAAELRDEIKELNHGYGLQSKLWGIIPLLIRDQFN